MIDEDGNLVAEASEELAVSHPGPLKSEQNPDDWWTAVDAAVRSLSNYTQQIQAIGLSGQMHGAVLLDKHDKPLRPAILWNDGRSGEECGYLEEKSNVREITGNAAMPGFTAPKLLWVRKHEPDIFGSVSKVLLPKDYIRLLMTGCYATDMSDASGTLWLDTASRTWTSTMLEVTHLTESHMPELFEGNEVTATLLPAIARRWSMHEVPVVGGAGDQAAGAIGAGAVTPGHATISLGTSGVIFAPDDKYQPNPDEGVHTFCHAIPNTWHQMAVILSAAGSLSWITKELGFESEAQLMLELQTDLASADIPIFLPYLTGERTPHNDAHAKGVFMGLTPSTNKYAMAYAVLEGVAFALRDCRDVLVQAGADLSTISLIGGGTQSGLWTQLISDVLDMPLNCRDDAAVGPALGAARLAMLGTTGRSTLDVCRSPAIQQQIHPRATEFEEIERRYALYRNTYKQLSSVFHEM